MNQWLYNGKRYGLPSCWEIAHHVDGALDLKIVIVSSSSSCHHVFQATSIQADHLVSFFSNVPKTLAIAPGELITTDTPEAAKALFDQICSALDSLHSESVRVAAPEKPRVPSTARGTAHADLPTRWSKKIDGRSKEKAAFTYFMAHASNRVTYGITVLESCSAKFIRALNEVSQAAKGLPKFHSHALMIYYCEVLRAQAERGFYPDNISPKALGVDLKLSLTELEKNPTVSHKLYELIKGPSAKRLAPGSDKSTESSGSCKKVRLEAPKAHSATGVGAPPVMPRKPRGISPGPKSELLGDLAANWYGRFSDNRQNIHYNYKRSFSTKAISYSMTMPVAMRERVFSALDALSHLTSGLSKLRSCALTIFYGEILKRKVGKGYYSGDISPTALGVDLTLPLAELMKNKIVASKLAVLSRPGVEHGPVASAATANVFWEPLGQPRRNLALEAGAGIKEASCAP